MVCSSHKFIAFDGGSDGSYSVTPIAVYVVKVIHISASFDA